MNKLLIVLAAALLVARAATADIPPPPPPKGTKYVSVNNEVVLGKDVTGYVFVQRVGQGPGAPHFTYNKVELAPGKAVAMPAAGRYTYVSLLAVPQDAAKEFKTDAELFDALKANKVKGVQSVGFAGTDTVPDAVKGQSVTVTHTITAIGAPGIKTKVEGEGLPPAGKPAEKDSPLTGSAPGRWVAVVAASAAALLGGLWVVGRGRRKA